MGNKSWIELQTRGDHPSYPSSVSLCQDFIGSSPLPQLAPETAPTSNRLRNGIGMNHVCASGTHAQPVIPDERPTGTDVWDRRALPCGSTARIAVASGDSTPDHLPLGLDSKRPHEGWPTGLPSRATFEVILTYITQGLVYPKKFFSILRNEQNYAPKHFAQLRGIKIFVWLLQQHEFMEEEKVPDWALDLPLERFQSKHREWYEGGHSD